MKNSFLLITIICLGISPNLFAYDRTTPNTQTALQEADLVLEGTLEESIPVGWSYVYDVHNIKVVSGYLPDRSVTLYTGLTEYDTSAKRKRTFYFKKDEKVEYVSREGFMDSSGFLWILIKVENVNVSKNPDGLSILEGKIATIVSAHVSSYPPGKTVEQEFQTDKGDYVIIYSENKIDCPNRVKLEGTWFEFVVKPLVKDGKIITKITEPYTERQFDVERWTCLSH